MEPPYWVEEVNSSCYVSCCTLQSETSHSDDADALPPVAPPTTHLHRSENCGRRRASQPSIHAPFIGRRPRANFRRYRFADQYTCGGNACRANALPPVTNDIFLPRGCTIPWMCHRQTVCRGTAGHIIVYLDWYDGRTPHVAYYVYAINHIDFRSDCCTLFCSLASSPVWRFCASLDSCPPKTSGRQV